MASNLSLKTFYTFDNLNKIYSKGVVFSNTTLLNFVIKGQIEVLQINKKTDIKKILSIQKVTFLKLEINDQKIYVNDTNILLDIEKNIRYYNQFTIFQNKEYLAVGCVFPEFACVYWFKENFIQIFDKIDNLIKKNKRYNSNYKLLFKKVYEQQ